MTGRCEQFKNILLLYIFSINIHNHTNKTYIPTECTLKHAFTYHHKSFNPSKIRILATGLYIGANCANFKGVEMTFWQCVIMATGRKGMLPILPPKSQNSTQSTTGVVRMSCVCIFIEYLIVNYCESGGAKNICYLYTSKLPPHTDNELCYLGQEGNLNW